MTEKEKMELGLWYDANFDKELLELRLEAEDLCFELNNIRPKDAEKRNAILQKLISDLGENCTILSPFITDYGCYSHITVLLDQTAECIQPFTQHLRKNEMQD